MRPALDGPGAALDRAKMWIYETFAQYGLPCPVTGHPSSGGRRGEWAASAAAAAGEQQQQQRAGSG